MGKQISRLGLSLLNIFSWPRPLKRAVQVGVDFSTSALALFTVLLLAAPYSAQMSLLLAAIGGALAVSLIALLGGYHAMVRYVSARFLLLASAAGATVALAIYGLGGALFELTSARLAFDLMVVTIAALGIPRFFLRVVYESIPGGGRSRVAIYGAGESGRQLAQALQAGRQCVIVGFVDDDPNLWGTRIGHVRVFNPEKLKELCSDWGISKLLLAMPSITRADRREIINRLEGLSVAVQSVPSIGDLVSGRAKIAELRNLEVDDLLGREPVAPVQQLIEHDIRSRSVLVTGAGGSIGSELCRQIVKQKPRRLVLFEQSEYALYQIERELTKAIDKSGQSTQLVAILGSICDRNRVANMLAAYKIETLYHAAAYKHVPLVEANGIAGIQNNVLGTWVTANAALKQGVESFVLVSTDKAVRSTSLMGASKRVAELGVQALAKVAGRTRFSIVRFGNVLGSSGSVVPLFMSQIEQGGPVTVTHRDMTRYFMTIPEAAQLVIQAGALAQAGEVFLLDMGEPVKIYDLAERMIRLSGLEPCTPERPDGDITIEITGVRPGEKLYEELLIADASGPTEHPRISRCDEPSVPLSEYTKFVEALQEAIGRDDLEGIRRLFLDIPAAYMPGAEYLQDAALAEVAFGRKGKPKAQPESSSSSDSMAG